MSVGKEFAYDGEKSLFTADKVVSRKSLLMKDSFLSGSEDSRFVNQEDRRLSWNEKTRRSILVNGVRVT